MDLFDAGQQDREERDQPLAARLRPRHLDEFSGQEHIVGPGRLLRRAIEADQLSSLIFYGPPGTGKTTLASVIAHTSRFHFITINAVLAGVADIRRAIDAARDRRKFHDQRTILFVDEVHRFNKAQQDALLPWVENGTVVLIGATTENPYFSVNRPLLSRSRVFQLESLDQECLRRIARQALADERGYAHLEVDLRPDALDHLVNVANGDARALLNALELAVETTPADEGGSIVVDLEVAEESIQRRAVLYDKEGDYHFDIISALIKSMRGSDPDATMYWLARMVYAGEDPHFILRRMLIFASEDVGLAAPQALQVVVAAAESFERTGLPEGRFALAHAALYLATAPKSNSVFAFFDALAAVEQESGEEVPDPLKDASRDAEGFGHGANYLYPHAYRDHWVAQQYLPDALQGRVFFEPTDQGYESRIRDQVRSRRELQLAAMVEGQADAPAALYLTAAERSRDQWLQRITSEISAQLARTRERVFKGLQLQQHHLVLDLNAGTGLMTWEALRRVPAGGVWSLSSDKAAAIALQEVAAHLPEVERPTVVQGPLESIGEMLAAAGGGVRFDAIIGRNALGAREAKEDIAASLPPLLASGGRLSLAEAVPRRAQRLHQLVDLDSLGADLGSRVAAAEEAIYADAGNPQVNWDADNLQELLEAAGFKVDLRLETESSPHRVTPRQLGHWFNPGGEKHHTFAHYLGRSLDDGEVRQVRKVFEKQLGNRVVQWSSTQVFAVAELA